MSDQFKPETENQRRDFLKKGGFGFAAALVGAKFALRSTQAQAQGAAAAPAAPEAKPAGGDKALVMVKPADPMAQSLGYVEDASKVDTKKWPKRAGKEGANQYCYNCQFYQVTGDPKATKAGPCTIFAGKGVTAKGWCNSWVQNPKAKG